MGVLWNISVYKGGEMICELCGTKWECGDYDDTKCPKCGQEYIYDENITIKLDDEQRKILFNLKKLDK
jgi:uncharacterized Zn ribbon protein